MGCNVSKIGASKEANASSCYHFRIISRKKDRAGEDGFSSLSSNRLPGGGSKRENCAKTDKNENDNNENNNNNTNRHDTESMKKNMVSEGEGEAEKDKAMASDKDKTDGHEHDMDAYIDFPRSPSFNVFCSTDSMNR